MSNLQSKILLQQGDITQMVADAIVNAANTSLLGGGGVDGAIHKAGGKAILEDCRKIIARQGGCKVGQAVITGAGNLSAQYVIHTVGPVWNGGAKKEREKLASCYQNALELAVAHDCKTIAFPSISTGIYRFPKAEAAKVAIATIADFLNQNETIEQVILVCFDEENFTCIEKELKHLDVTTSADVLTPQNDIGEANFVKLKAFGFVQTMGEDKGMYKTFVWQNEVLALGFHYDRGLYDCTIKHVDGILISLVLLLKFIKNDINYCDEALLGAQRFNTLTVSEYLQEFFQNYDEILPVLKKYTTEISTLVDRFMAENSFKM